MQIIQRAASFDWETLLPVIFFILYGVAQFFGSKKKGDAVEEEETPPSEDPMERARQIREEIRRKIAERKEAGEQAAPGQEAATGRRYAYDPNLPESQQGERRTTQPPAQKPRPVVVHQAQPVQAKSPVSGIQDRLAEQRKRLEEARKQREAAMKQARKMTHEAGAGHRPGAHRAARSGASTLLDPSDLREELIRGLRHPNTIRKAVLYREILDPPLGLR